MLWFLLWVALVLGAAAVFLVLGRDLWRKSRALVRELGEAGDRLAELGDRLAELEEARADTAAHGHLGQPGDVRSQRSSPRQQR